MKQNEPSWWHMLWIIPSVIVTEALMVLGIMKRESRKNEVRNATN